MDQLPRLGKGELICLLSFTCNNVVSVWRCLLFLWVLWMSYVILLWHSLSLPYNYFTSSIKKVKSMHRSGTEAIRAQTQPSKPKRKITKITNSQNTNRTYGQPSEKLFSKRWPLSNPNRTKIIRTHVGDTSQKLRHKKQATEDHNQTSAVERSVMNYWWPSTCKTSPSVSEVV